MGLLYHIRINKGFMQDNQRQTHWAYIAGILDADGCFMITKHKRKTPEDRKWHTLMERSPTYMPTIKICMIEIEAISFISDDLGFGKYQLHGARKSRPTCKPIYHWYVRGRKWVIPFLKEVIPYLRVKKTRAIFLLNFCRKMKLTTDGYHGTSAEELNYREDSYIKMRELNGNKVAATTKFCGLERASDSLNS